MWRNKQCCASQVFGGGPGSLWSPDVIFAMKQGDVRVPFHAEML